MNIHVKLEFDLDTATNVASKVRPEVQLLEAGHLCAWPACGKAIPIEKKYCDGSCFRAHGVRVRTKGKALQEATPPLRIEVQPVLPQEGRERPSMPDYRSFTFPQQGGLS